MIRMVDGLAVETIGEGLPLLFLHGLTCDRKSWYPFVDHLGEGYRCILVDLPGHGASDPLPEADYDFRAIARRLQLVIAALGIDLPLLVGHSMGGVVAACLAANAPSRGLLVLDQPLEVTAFVAAVQQAYGAGGGAALLDLWNTIAPSFAIGDLPEASRALIAACRRPDAALLTGYWRPLLDIEPVAFQQMLDGILSGISVPCRSVHAGTYDSAYETWLRQRISQAQVRWLPDGTHFPHLRYPEEIAVLVRELSPTLLSHQILSPQKRNPPRSREEGSDFGLGPKT